MGRFKNVVKILFTKELAKKVIAFVVLIAFLFLFKGFAFTFFLTFVFAFLFLSMATYIRESLDKGLTKIWYVEDKRSFLRKNFWIDFFIVLEYVLFITMIIFIIYNILPQIIRELSEIPKMIPIIESQVQDIKDKLIAIKDFNTQIEWDINQIITSWDYEIIINIYDRIKAASIILFHFALSIILSFVFLIDRKRLIRYLKWIKSSNFYFIHDEYKTILVKISKSFWLILKAQSIIALVNTILTLIWLLIIWDIYSPDGSFPYILTLWLIVFIFWFVPVLWVFISSIPIVIISYTMWWWQASAAVIALVVVVHIVEAYYLNPKIVSSYLELPVSLTFVILIVSEHVFWFAGLLVWVSLFYFVVWILNDFDKVVSKTKRKIKKTNNLELKQEKQLN